MLNKQDNERLTRVGPGTPMGELLREYWMPAVRSKKLEADGKPERIRLLGEDFVAFRATDGRVGFIDEGCPHRVASMALGRNEENGLRCLFHGWKVDVEGRVVDTPTEPEDRRERFASLVPTRRFKVHEAGGVVWVYIGQKQEAPPFPEFEFTGLPDTHLNPMRGLMKCSWLQALEAALDSAHVGFLHARGGKAPPRGTERSRVESDFMRINKAPVFEFEVTPHGFKEAALRVQPDGDTYGRIREVALPFYSLIPRLHDQPGLVVASIPIDDENTAQWYLRYDVNQPINYDPAYTSKFGTNSGDPDFFNSDMGGLENMWNQDRQAMKDGHWSGIVNRTNAYEDFIVQESMGPIVDRSKEYLGASDVVISLARRQLLAAVKKHEEGEGPSWMDGVDFRSIRSISVVLKPGRNWRNVDPLNLEPIDAG
jgi:phenylpropionate dioxygenase-like ring-hydroxylating dioxygenase large terminal subunit